MIPHRYAGLDTRSRASASRGRDDAVDRIGTVRMLREMPRDAMVLLVLAGASAIALADPASILLSKDQIVAAEKAAQANLPPVDQSKLAECQKLRAQIKMDAPTAPELFALGKCFRSAGSLGAAITIWERLSQRYPTVRYPTAPEREDAEQQLGSAYEAAGLFDKAADAYDNYVYGEYGLRDGKTSTHDLDVWVRGRLDLEIRAVCIWEQLGRNEKVTKRLAFLTRHAQLDPAHLCDANRPIQPPMP